MARFIFMLVLIVVAALANEPSTKVEEHNEKQIQCSNAINDRLDQLAKIVNETNDQVVELRKLVEQHFKSSNATDKPGQQDLTVNQTQDQLNDRCNKIVRTQNLTTLPNGKKYFFSYPTHLYEANWTQANEICTRQMGMNLATIKDQADFDAIWNEAKTIQNNGWWLSARKYTKGDGHTDFYWHDQTLLAESNHGAWRLIQPGGECVYIYTPAGVKKFSATVCNTVWYFVCELPADCY
ncbi:uncharacterized protein LOC132193417 isoform X1 [Neocloeon triangulifer]|uniref:uncharacterized protein LOC132193417 isoform X1 n=1 Tax=Neocloeon triangulifer TaxID=2078957 RepID=UPI00286FAE0E|nr:uncharacterized protein LOC132193417 isoform X1 [Neocloeon triangulifer]